MDCHVFRRLCDELIPALSGARMEKIHQPAEDVVTFSLYACGRKQVLFCKFGRKAPMLFLSSHRIPVGAEPPASVMRLRKYLSGQRVTAGLAVWAERRLLLRFHELPQGGQRVWLDLDLREGPRLLLLPTSPECAEPAWPDLDAIATSGLSGEDWRAWPVLSPALRRTLTQLEPAEQAALLADLEYGGGDLFAYGLPEDGTPGTAVDLSAWPLPQALRGQRPERVFSSAIQATTLTGEKGLLEELAHRAGQQNAKVHKDAVKRLGRLIDKLHGERQRLETMAGRKADALALQAELYRFQPTEKAASVELDARPGAPLELDPRHTVRENMARWFHQAARGERGLAMLAPRLAALLEEQQQERQLAEQAVGQRTLPAFAGQAPTPPDRPGTESLRKKTAPLPKNVQAFQSDDGFLLLRGRDADGNARLLKLASPHDYWLHVGGAASAHVVIRRAHARQDVPERTLLQAGLLAAQKSERQHDARVDIVAALARHVKPLKTAGGRRPGNVRIDEIAWTRTVPLDGSVPEPAALAPAVPAPRG